MFAPSVPVAPLLRGAPVEGVAAVGALGASGALGVFVPFVPSVGGRPVGFGAGARLGAGVVLLGERGDESGMKPSFSTAIRRQLTETYRLPLARGSRAP